jgi:putative lipoic acid-binding regulatory protein
MYDLPTIELLETTHQFPCAYMFKVIGRPDNGFVARVVAAVREELAFEIDPPFRLRKTATGGYVCVTVEPQVQRVHQVLAVYRRLQMTPGLIMLM